MALQTLLEIAVTVQRKRKGQHKYNQLKPAAIAALLKKIPERLAAGENVKAKLADGGNLYLAVVPSGSASWVFRYTLNGKCREMGLGSERVFNLTEARERAHKARQSLADGIDPLDQKIDLTAQTTSTQAVKKAASKTFFEILENFIKDKAPEHKDATWSATWRNSLTEYAKPIFKETPINKITYDMALAVFNRVITVDGEEKTFWLGYTETASRVRQRIITIMKKVAIVPGYDGESPLLWDARFDSDLPNADLSRECENYPSLKYTLVPDFVAALHKRGSVLAHYLEFLILTAGPRSTPTLTATWDQMDIENKIWTVPRGNLKAKKNAVLKNFVVPLSDRCIQILEEMKKVKQDDFVFPSAKKGAPMSRSRITEMIEDMCVDDEKAGIARRWVDPDVGNDRIVPHGFRASFSSFVQDKLDVSEELRNFALGHKVKGNVSGAYDRGVMLDKRRAMMDAWADHAERRAA